MIILPPHFEYVQPLFDDDIDRLSILYTDLDWSAYTIRMFWKTFLQPRLVAFYGDIWVQYAYSQTNLIAKDRHPMLASIKNRIIEYYPEAASINSVLCNLYRNGNDSMGWHADDESVLWANPYIYSVSLWATRSFHIKSYDWSKKYKILLENNSLLMMWDGSQVDRLHAIPKTKQNLWMRINLTFRTIGS